MLSKSVTKESFKNLVRIVYNYRYGKLEKFRDIMPFKMWLV